MFSAVTPIAADTYWGALGGEQNPSDIALVASGASYATNYQLTLRDSIPAGATINGTELLLDLDDVRSAFGSFHIAMDWLRTTEEDTLRTPFFVNSWIVDTGEPRLEVSRNWLQQLVIDETGEFVISFRPMATNTAFNWLVIDRVRNQVVYTEPPRTD